MDRLKARGTWSFFDPQDVPLLQDTHSTTFTERYIFYEGESKAIRTLPALDVWQALLKAKFHTGGPTIVFSDIHKGELICLTSFTPSFTRFEVKSNFNYFTQILSNPPSSYSQYPLATTHHILATTLTFLSNSSHTGEIG